MTETKKKSQQEVLQDKADRIMNGIDLWAGFYRNNPHRFAKDYLNVVLKPFQQILLYEMMHNNYSLYVASRGQGKTFLMALFAIIRCILFPHTKICVASATRSQANELLSKIEDEFMKGFGWGSDNLKREITYHTVGTNKAVIEFANGSWIKVVTSSDSARGNRANILIIDEFWMLDLNTINTVLRKFLSASRHPGYLDNPKYQHLQERNKEMYAGSAWMKSHWSFKKAKTYFVNMLDDQKKYFVCGLPYQIAIKDNLLNREQVEDEMSEADFDEIKWQTEMEALFFGDKEEAFFKFDDVNDNRKLKTAIYPLKITNRYRELKIPDLAHNERRILSVDIALMASSKHKNDATSIFINSAIPTNNNKYIGNIIYTENHEGKKTEELALIIRRLFAQFKCTDLVIDTNGGYGLGIFDILTEDMIDPDTGDLYPALSCCNDPAMRQRCKVANAPEVIWSIKAHEAFNTRVCTLLRSGFQNGKINLLVSEFASEELLKDRIKTFKKLQPQDQLELKMPYVQTTLLIYELINLEYETRGTNIKLIEKSGMRKDRYSSLAYNYYVQCELERDLRKPTTSLKKEDILEAYRKLNKKPKTY